MHLYDMSSISPSKSYKKIANIPGGAGGAGRNGDASCGSSN